jgi:hypothetical protein
MNDITDVIYALGSGTGDGTPTDTIEVYDPVSGGTLLPYTLVTGYNDAAAVAIGLCLHLKITNVIL